MIDHQIRGSNRLLVSFLNFLNKIFWGGGEREKRERLQRTNGVESFGSDVGLQKLFHFWFFSYNGSISYYPCLFQNCAWTFIIIKLFTGKTVSLCYRKSFLTNIVIKNNCCLFLLWYSWNWHAKLKIFLKFNDFNYPITTAV